MPALIMRADTISPKPMVHVEYGDTVLKFQGAIFTRDGLHPKRDPYDPFEYINEYWASLPEDKRSQIFDIYSAVDYAFDQVTDEDELYQELVDATRRLMVYHDLDRLRIFLSLNPTVIVPDSVLEKLPDPNESVFTAEKTYTRADYYPLITFSLFLRTMIPIWGQYIAAVRENIENTRKEYVAMQILMDVGLFECEAMDRMRSYIESTLGSNQVDNNRIMAGFSTEDTCFLLMAVTCIKKICLADISGRNSRSQVVAVLFKYIAHRLASGDVNGITIKETPAGEDSDSNGKHSVLEAYVKRVELGIGEIAEMESYYTKLYDIAQRLEPTIDLNDVALSIESAQSLNNRRLTQVQTALLSWVIKNQITPHSAMYVSKRHLVGAVGMVEAVLWHRGFKYFAGLITSYAVIGDSNDIAIGTISSREQLSQEKMKQIQIHYPYIWSRNKKGDTVKLEHPVLLAIEGVVDTMISYAFRSTIRDSRLKEAFGNNRRRVEIIPNIKDGLADLIIDIEVRQSQIPTLLEI